MKKDLEIFFTQERFNGQRKALLRTYYLLVRNGQKSWNFFKLATNDQAPW